MEKTKFDITKKLNSWGIILFVTILTISTINLSSCSNARSVRNIKTSPLLEKQEKSPKTQKISKNSFEQTPAISDNVTIEDNQPTIIPENVVRQIPTLREQMAIIAEDQKAANSRLDNIENEINSIKEIVKNIAYDLSDLKSDLDIAPIAGRNPETHAPQTNHKNNRTILLPDEKSTSQSNVRNNDKLIEKAMNETFFDKEVTRNRSANPVNPKEIVKSSDPTPQETTKITESPELNDAKILFDKGSYAQALSHFKAALHKETSKTRENEINFYIGRCYFELGDYDAALANFAKVINAKDNQFMDYAQLLTADSKLKTGRVNEARNDYKQLIENNPTSRHAPKARKMLQKI